VQEVDIPEDLLWSTPGADTSLAEDDDTLRVAGDEIEVVGDHDDRGAAAMACGNDLHEARDRSTVKSHGGLVEHENGCVHRQDSGKRHLPAESIAEHGRWVVAERREAEQRQAL
jgi:hypothetical protein